MDTISLSFSVPHSFDNRIINPFLYYENGKRKSRKKSGTKHLILFIGIILIMNYIFFMKKKYSALFCEKGFWTPVVLVWLVVIITCQNENNQTNSTLSNTSCPGGFNVVLVISNQTTATIISEVYCVDLQNLDSSRFENRIFFPLPSGNEEEVYLNPGFYDLEAYSNDKTLVGVQYSQNLLSGCRYTWSIFDIEITAE